MASVRVVDVAEHGRANFAVIGEALSQLHSIVLERLLGLDAEKVREQTHIRYLRDAGEAVDQVRRGEANVAFLTNPVTLDQLKEVAFAGEVMPQKSTYFYPKVLSGLLVNKF